MVCYPLLFLFLLAGLLQRHHGARGLSIFSVDATRTQAAAPSQRDLATLSFSEVPIGLSHATTARAAEDENDILTATTIGERLQQGASVIELHDLATAKECRFLVKACLQAANDDDNDPSRALDKPGLVRLPTIAAAERAAATQTPCADPLPEPVDLLLQQILLRAAHFIDERLPSLSATLFDTKSLSSLMMTTSTTTGTTKDDNQRQRQEPLLQYSSREPAMNVYTPGGEFLAHKDAQALTLLLPLSCPNDAFWGGGTAFWSQDARGHRVEDPSLVLKPSAGTAMLFGGCVTHAGVAVEWGTRVVFVASFSRCRSGGTTEPVVAMGEHRDIYGDSM